MTKGHFGDASLRHIGHFLIAHVTLPKKDTWPNLSLFVSGRIFRQSKASVVKRREIFTTYIFRFRDKL